jgi:hypothetical protein
MCDNQIQEPGEHGEESTRERNPWGKLPIGLYKLPGPASPLPDRCASSLRMVDIHYNRPHSSPFGAPMKVATGAVSTVEEATEFIIDFHDVPSGASCRDRRDRHPLQSCPDSSKAAAWSSADATGWQAGCDDTQAARLAWNTTGSGR